MKLSEFKDLVAKVPMLQFELPDGTTVPSHYHVTEVGQIDKKFIDCGGTIRHEQAVNFQLWYSDDVDHRLEPHKMLDIIALSEKHLGIEDHEIEVEFQADTIGKYGLSFDGNAFVLTTKMTDCLAPDKCLVPAEKPQFDLSNMAVGAGSCTPGSGCC